MPKVSVIVPVYNVEHYVSFCIDSLRAQTLSDIEILCVNDGSKDRSADIARIHAALDSRVRVIEKENGGLSSARNAGMKAASGDYLVFVDSDDWAEPKACEKIVAAFEEHDADIVTFGANLVPAKFDNEWLRDCLSPIDVVYSPFDPDVLFKEKSHPYAWRTALRTTFARENNIEFDESVKFGEDQVFHFEVYPLAHTTALISDKLYNYRLTRSNSLMSSIEDSGVKRVSQHLNIIDAILRHWQARGFLELCSTRFIDWVFDFIGFDLLNLPSPTNAKYLGELETILSKYYDTNTLSAEAFPAVGKLIDTGRSINEGSMSEIPSSLIFEYKRYRVGMKAIIQYSINNFLKRGRKESWRVRTQNAIECNAECASAERQLNTSLQLLSLEAQSSAKN